MKRAGRSIAWGLAILVVVGACVPTEEPPGKPGAKPKTSAPAAKPGAKPTAQPAPPPAKPDAVFVFSPQQRRNFAQDELAELTVVVGAGKPLTATVVAVTLKNAENTAWTTTDTLGALPAGRHAVTYGLQVGKFPEGDYTLTVEVNEVAAGPVELTIVSGVPQTHFPIAGWIEKPPRTPGDAVRWAKAMGLNTMLLQKRAPWGKKGVVDGKFTAAWGEVAKAPTAKPMELRGKAPEFIQTADLLTGAGLRWMNWSAVSGGGQARLQPDRQLVDPQVIQGARQRIHHRVLAERAFSRCLGVHFSDESSLGWNRTATYEGPFGQALRVAAFRKATGSGEVQWRRGATWDGWHPFLAWRAGILGRALADWTAAVQAIEPGYLAASQLYGPTRLAEGVYPPLTARGLPVAVVQTSLDGPAGMMMPAAAIDLQRLGNWSQRVWFMPEIDVDAEIDEVRAAMSLALARRVDGLVYPTTLDYHLDRPGGGQFPLALVESIAAINQPLVHSGDLLLAAHKPRGDVAILYSVTEHGARIGRNPTKDPRAASYPWSLITAYEACHFAHFSPTFLTEGELLAGEGAKSKAVLVVAATTLRPEVKARLEELAKSNVAVLTTDDTTVKIDGALELGLSFPSLDAYHDEVWRKGEEQKVDTTLERRDEVAQAKLIYPELGNLRKKLKEFVQRDYTVSDKGEIICHQELGDTELLFVVNNEQRTDVFRGLKWELSPAKTRVTLREGRKYRIFDVFQGHRVLLPYVGDRPVLNLTQAAGGIKCLAILPEMFKGVYISEARVSAGKLHIAANVHNAPRDRRKYLRVPFKAGIPLEITVRDGAGKIVRQVYRCHLPTGYKDALPVPTMATPGAWTVEVRELFSGEKATERFRVSAATPRSWLRRRGRLACSDGPRIAALLASAKPLWILVGTPDEAKKAEPLAKALAKPDRAVEIKLAKDLAKPRRLDAKAAPTYTSAAPGNAAMPDVRQPAIILGSVATNPLLAKIHDYGLLPRSLSPDHPGPGGALLCWQLSAFEPDVETVAAAAADPAGLDRAVAALIAAATPQGAAPQTAWTPLPAGKPEPDKRMRPPAKILKTLWRNRTLDVPTAAVLPIGSARIIVGFFHGDVQALDVIGKAEWSHWCMGRARAVAASFDGAWTAAASFPEISLLTARGRVEWAVPLEETSLRADHTAVAMSPRGEIIVAGTRQGKVQAITMDKRQVFRLGDEDADERTEGWQSRFGTINAIALSPKGDAVVIAGENELAAVDTLGEALWSNTDLKRVIALAVSLTEEPAVAAGSRDGSVVVLDKQGAAKWRAAAGGYVPSVAFRGATTDVLAASLGGSATCYDPEGKVRWRRRSPVGFRHVAASLDGEVIAVAEHAGKVLLLDATGELLAESPELPGAIRVMAIAANGQFILVGTSANELMLLKYERPKADQDDL